MDDENEEIVHGMVDLLQPCRPWPAGFEELTADQAIDLLIVATQGAAPGIAQQHAMTMEGIHQGNLSAAMHSTGRIAVMPTLRGQRRLN